MRRVQPVLLVLTFALALSAFALAYRTHRAQARDHAALGALQEHRAALDVFIRQSQTWERERAQEAQLRSKQDEAADALLRVANALEARLSSPDAVHQ